MSVNICPAAVVAAPLESVWEILSDTKLYEEWWEARAERIVPEGEAVPGQIIYLETAGLGRKWAMTLRIETVNPEKHQILFHGELLGSISHNVITCTAIDDASSAGAAFAGAASCRVQYG
jgi:hypothetical protein